MLGLWLSALALVAGFVQGHVYDARTGKGLPGANVFIEGTHLGAATDENGAYVIPDVPPGKYRVTASMLGYTSKTYTVEVGRRGVTVDFYLEEEAITLEQEIVVTAKRPLLEKKVSATLRTLSSQDLENLGATNAVTALSTQAGVVSFGTREVHIRGGRTNEIVMMIDGIPVRDPLSGNAFTVYIPSTAVQEYEAVLGGFNAEHGEAMSGIIQVKIREGGDRWHTSISGRTDHPYLFRYFDTDQVDASLSGPLARHLPLLGRLTMFGNLFYRSTNTYLPHVNQPLYSSVIGTDRLSPREENELSGILKFAFTPNDRQKIYLTLTKSLEINQGYFYYRRDYPFAYGFPYRYIEILDHYPVFTRESNQAILSFKHMLTPRSFYEVRLSRVFSNLHLDVQGKHWSEYQERRDDVPPYGFYDAGDAPYWHDHYVESYILKADWTLMPRAVHTAKTGLLLNYTEAQWIDIQYPWFYSPDGLGLNHDVYRVYTTRGGFYVQDRITFAGMVANIGLRYDFWVPGRYLERGVARGLASGDLAPIVAQEYQRYLDETPKLPGTSYHYKGHLSPRIGIAYPVTDVDKFFFSYGHFSQMPDFKYVYSKLGVRASSSYELVGNPNLKPQVTVAYELGWEHLLSRNLKMSLVAYYKDIFNYPTARKVPGIPPNPDYWMYFNADYARTVGLETRLEKRLSDHWFGRMELTLSQAKGRSSTEEDYYFVGGEESLGEWYLRWDRPYEMFLTLGYRLGPDEHLRVGPWTLPGDWQVVLNASYSAGRRYTPIDTLGNPGERNSRLGPPWHRVDLSFRKGFRAAGGTWTFRLSVRNLFNHRNVYYVNPVTGRAYEPGDPLPPRTTPLEMLNPARYRAPRSIQVGLEARF